MLLYGDKYFVVNKNLQYSGSLEIDKSYQTCFCKWPNDIFPLFSYKLLNI